MQEKIENLMYIESQQDLMRDGNLKHKGVYTFKRARAYNKTVSDYAYSATGTKIQLNTPNALLSNDDLFKIGSHKLFKYPANITSKLNTLIPYDINSYYVTSLTQNETVDLTHYQAKMNTQIYTKSSKFYIKTQVDINSPFLKVGNSLYVRNYTEWAYNNTALFLKVTILSTSETAEFYTECEVNISSWNSLAVPTADQPAASPAGDNIPLDFDVYPEKELAVLQNSTVDISTGLSGFSMEGLWNISQKKEYSGYFINSPSEITYLSKGTGGAYYDYTNRVVTIPNVDLSSTITALGNNNRVYFCSKKVWFQVLSVDNTTKKVNVMVIHKNGATGNIKGDWMLSYVPVNNNFCLGDINYDAVKFDLHLQLNQTHSQQYNIYLMYAKESSLDLHNPVLQYASDFSFNSSECWIDTLDKIKPYNFVKSMTSFPQGDPVVSIRTNYDNIYNIQGMSLRLGRPGVFKDRRGATVRDTSFRRGDPVANALPSGLVMKYEGSASPFGYREVIGQVNEPTVAAYSSAAGTTGAYIPSDTFIQLSDFKPISSGAVQYLSSEHVTRITLELKAGVTSDLIEDTFSDWNVKFKEVEVDMLPLPDPPPITLFGLKIGTRPPLPPRKPRTYLAAVGFKNLTVKPGCQLMVSTANGLRNIRSSDVVSPFVSLFKFNTQATHKEASFTGATTYPASYPTTIVENIFGAFYSLLQGSGQTWQQTNYWLYKMLHDREPLPAISSKTISSKLEIYLLGRWDSHISSTVSGDNLFLVKTGYMKHTLNSAGSFDWGADEHNHILKELSDVQLRNLNLDASGFYDTTMESDGNASIYQNMPAIARLHTNGYLGQGGFSRPVAKVVKVCLKE